MDLQVLWPGPDGGQFLGAPGSIWPAIQERIVGLAKEHRSTLIFANNRRTVEKLAIRSTSWPRPNRPNKPRTRPAPAWFRPHHGSLSLEERRSTEEELKRGGRGRDLDGLPRARDRHGGRRPGLPGGIAGQHRPRLQRLGRAGHVVHGVSKGRLIAKTPRDLLETAALARAMVEGNIEQSEPCPMVALTSWPSRWSPAWDVTRPSSTWSAAVILLTICRPEVFERVLCLVSGRFPTGLTTRS